MALKCAAGVHLKVRRAMGEGIHVERFNDGQLVHVLSDVWEGI